MFKPTFKLAVLLAALFANAAVFAQESKALIDALIKKGILTEQEAADIKADLVKESKSSPAGKWNIGSSVSEMKLSGDGRVRFEYRGGSNASPDHFERERFRHRFRLGLQGKMADTWFFGTRIETADSARSTNVTLGDASNSPFGKAKNGLYLGQIYVGFKPTSEITLTAGRFANPIVSTSMVWDGDINPEGLAEQWAHKSGDVTWIANFGQFVYDDANPENAFGSSANKSDMILLANQIGAKFTIDKNSSLQVLPVVYFYQNTDNKGGEVGSSSQAYFIGELPIEYSFTAAGQPWKVWLDVAKNFDADKRARILGVPQFDGEDMAYQAGVQYGKAGKRGTWEARAFYQHVEAFALDINLVDSDIFDSRTNMKGWSGSIVYALANGITATLTYANGDRLENGLPTFGSGDIGTTSLTDYQLLQTDLSFKF